MKKRRLPILVGSVLLSVAVAAVCIHFAKADHPADSKSEEDKPVATVTTAPVRSGALADSIVAYGVVAAEPGSVAVYSVPLEARVAHLRVNGGQAVEKDAVLAEIEPSPDAKLQLIEARNSLENAKKDAAQMQQKFDLKLATSGELQSAQAGLQTAQVRADDLQARGAAEPNKKIVATAAGLVGKITVQEGQLVPAGGPLLEVVPAGSIEVRLGVEPADIASIKTDQPVQIFQVNGSADAIPGKVRLITRRINPDTRLVDVFVTTEAKSLLLDSPMRGEFSASAPETLIVPRDAVQPDDQGFSVFTMKDGHAVKQAVKVLSQNDHEAGIAGEGIKENDAAIVGGNLELEDGMAVSAEAIQ